MTRKDRRWRIAPFAAGVLLAGCGEFGQVNQGQVVSYDGAAGVITFIEDTNYRDPANPRFDKLPPVRFRIPENPAEMGPAPEAGRLLALDAVRGEAIVFDEAAQNFKTVPIRVLDQVDGVFRDDRRLVGRALPEVDRERRTVTTYLARQRRLLTFTVAEEHLGLPAESWKAGDMVRYYYKSPDQALRVMNVTRTDVRQAGK